LFRVTLSVVVRTCSSNHKLFYQRLSLFRSRATSTKAESRRNVRIHAEVRTTNLQIGRPTCTCTYKLYLGTCRPSTSHRRKTRGTPPQSVALPLTETFGSSVLLLIVGGKSMAPFPRLSVFIAGLSSVVLFCSAFSSPPIPLLPLFRPSAHRLELHVPARPRRTSTINLALQMSGGHDSHDSGEGGQWGQPEISPAISLLGRSTSAFVSLTFFAFLAVRRDAYMISFFIGAITNGILSKVLKKVLNHDRPEALDRSDHIKLKPSDGGMPSSHAMSLGFIGAYTALGVAESMPWLAGLIAPYIVLSLYYRVKSSLHTVEQCGVGLFLGGELNT